MLINHSNIDSIVGSVTPAQGVLQLSSYHTGSAVLILLDSTIANNLFKYIIAYRLRSYKIKARAFILPDEHLPYGQIDYRPKIIPSLFFSIQRLEAALDAHPDALEGFTHVIIANQVYSITGWQPCVTPATTAELRALFEQYPPRYSSGNSFTAGEPRTAQRITELLRPQAAAARPITPIQMRPPAPPPRSSNIVYIQGMQCPPSQLSDRMIRVWDQRVGDIDSPAHSHVPYSRNGVPHDGMVHANYIHHPGKGRLILTQYPQPGSEFYFWTMLAQQRINLVADVSSSTEQNMPGEPGYLLRPGEAVDLACHRISRIEGRDGLSQYRIKHRATGRIRTIMRYHYPHWTDSQTISASDLAKLAKMVNQAKHVVIHGQTGVGRSAVVAAASILLASHRCNAVINGQDEKAVYRKTHQQDIKYLR